MIASDRFDQDKEIFIILEIFISVDQEENFKQFEMNLWLWYITLLSSIDFLCDLNICRLASLKFKIIKKEVENERKHIKIVFAIKFFKNEKKRTI